MLPLRLLACLLLPLCLTACTAPEVEPDLGSPRTAAQVPALVQAASPEADPGDVNPAALVARLDDPDPAVRLFAIGSLQRLTDRRFGYRWYREPADQREAVDAWKAWAAGPGPQGRP